MLLASASEKAEATHCLVVAMRSAQSGDLIESTGRTRKSFSKKRRAGFAIRPAFRLF